MTDVSRFLDNPVKVERPRGWLRALTQQEGLNFLLTNRIPRHAATVLMGRISRIQSPMFTRLAIAVWKRFSDLDLTEAAQQQFPSLHDCFIRTLKPGARPIDTSTKGLCSPCDAIVGACGRIEAGMVLQAKGFPYPIAELLRDPAMATQFEGGAYVTLRLTSSMYHRFHAPANLHLQHVTYLHGDTWNVNPIALKRVERLFCKNERAVLHTQLEDGTPLAIVPVAAILVASLRLHALDTRLHIRYRGPHELSIDAHYLKGEEMGWFEHGSTIIVLAPPNVELLSHIHVGHRIQMGQALMQQRSPTG